MRLSKKLHGRGRCAFVCAPSAARRRSRALRTGSRRRRGRRVPRGTRGPDRVMGSSRRGGRWGSRSARPAIIRGGTPPVCSPPSSGRRTCACARASRHRRRLAATAAAASCCDRRSDRSDGRERQARNKMEAREKNIEALRWGEREKNRARAGRTEARKTHTFSSDTGSGARAT